VSQISAPVRIVALIGVLAAAAMGAWMMTQGGGGPAAASAVDGTLKPVAEANALAGKLTAHNQNTAAGKPDTAAPAATPAAPAAKKAAAKPAAKAAKPVAPKKKAAPKITVPKGTPRTIAGQLAQHDIVIVLLYDPQAKVDHYSLAEAQVGAREAGAGFLRVNVLNQKEASPFTTAYGVLQDPTILFFKRPGKLTLKLTGYVDHETIAQAAANAARGLVSVA
jgi:hypothetical protein